MNRYSYALNNPLRYVDPSGEIVWFIVGAIIGAYIGGSAANNDWAPWNGGWNWQDPGTWFGIGFGALAGGLGLQAALGPGGWVAGGKLTINVGFNAGKWATAAGQFALESGALSWQGAGLATLAGGGIWLSKQDFSAPERNAQKAIYNAQVSAASGEDMFSPGGYALASYDGPKYIGGIAPAPDFSGISLVNGGRRIFKKFTHSNYRDNLKIFSGLDGIGLDAHHIFPQTKRFLKNWNDIGINIHHPKNMTWWKSTSHKMNAAKYNQYWDDFFNTYVSPTKKQAEEYAKWLMDLYN